MGAGSAYDGPLATVGTAALPIVGTAVNDDRGGGHLDLRILVERRFDQIEVDDEPVE